MSEKKIDRFFAWPIKRRRPNRLEPIGDFSIPEEIWSAQHLILPSRLLLQLAARLKRSRRRRPIKRARAIMLARPEAADPLHLAAGDEAAVKRQRARVGSARSPASRPEFILRVAMNEGGRRRQRNKSPISGQFRRSLSFESID